MSRRHLGWAMVAIPTIGVFGTIIWFAGWAVAALAFGVIATGLLIGQGIVFIQEG